MIYTLKFQYLVMQNDEQYFTHQSNIIKVYAIEMMFVTCYIVKYDLTGAMKSQNVH